jgi:hypothetical protein
LRPVGRGALIRRPGVDVVGFGVVHGNTRAASIMAWLDVIVPLFKPL